MTTTHCDATTVGYLVKYQVPPNIYISKHSLYTRKTGATVISVYTKDTVVSFLRHTDRQTPQTVHHHHHHHIPGRQAGSRRRGRRSRTHTPCTKGEQVIWEASQAQKTQRGRRGWGGGEGHHTLNPCMRYVTLWYWLGVGGVGVWVRPREHSVKGRTI